MPFYKAGSGSIVEIDPLAIRTVHARENFRIEVEAGRLVELPADRVVAVKSRHGGIVYIEASAATEAPAGAPTVETPAPADDGEKATLLAQLEAAGATNMSTLRRYSVDKLQAELAKLTEG